MPQTHETPLWVTSLIAFCLLICLLPSQTTASMHTIQIIEYAPDVLKTSPTSDSALANQLHNINVIHAMVQQEHSIVLLPEYGLQAPIMRTRDEARMFSQVLEMGHPRGTAEGNCSQWKFTQENDVFMMKTYLPESRSTLVLEKLSCLAQYHNTYVALNIVEQVPASTASSDEELFNTMFVLDRNGALVAKYRKRNLYGNEVRLFQVGHDDEPVLHTDFGMRFGLMICFDLMFDPHSVHNFASELDAWLVSSWWVNFPPQINAIQMQMAYALVFGKQLYVSNAGTTWHSSGSGGYDGVEPGGRVLASWYNPTMVAQSKSLVAEVSVREEKREMGFGQEEKLQSPKEISTSTPKLLQSLPTERLMEFKPFTIDSRSQNPSRFEASVSAGTVKCHLQATYLPAASTQTHIYAAYAISGLIWPVRRGDICGLIYCGTASQPNYNATEICDKTLTFKTMFQEAPAQFESIHLQVSFEEPVYGAFPLIAQTNMTLPRVGDSHVEEGALHWAPKEGADLHLSAFQMLGLRSETSVEDASMGLE